MSEDVIVDDARLANNANSENSLVLDQKIKNKNKLEAILFATGRFCEPDELIKHVNVKDKRELKKILKELQKEYEDRHSALKIIDQDGEYKMVVRDEHLEDIREILSNMELSKAVLETLAVIAWKKTIMQSDVIKVRGNSAYEHIRELEDLGFLTRIKEGVSKKITLTEKFYEYFNLGGEDLTNKMRREQQERLRILEEEVKRRKEEEDRIKEEEKQLKLQERQEIIEQKKQEMGISDGQTTLVEVVDKDNNDLGPLENNTNSEVEVVEDEPKVEVIDEIGENVGELENHTNPKVELINDFDEDEPKVEIIKEDEEKTSEEE